MGKAVVGLSNDTSVDSIWSVPQPHVEVLALVKMLGRNGANVEGLRELIEVPEETERHLRAFAAEFPDSKTRMARFGACERSSQRERLQVDQASIFCVSSIVATAHVY